MTSETTTPVRRKRPWWRWIVLPFLAIPAIFVGVPVLIGIAVIVPIAMVKGWRLDRRLSRKLSAEGRRMDFSDALTQYHLGGKDLVVEIGPKGICAVWLVQVPPTARDCVDSLPTYATYECDTRNVYSATLEKGKPEIDQLIPYMNKAIRVNDSREKVQSKIAELNSDLKASIRIVGIWQEASPSRLLQASLDQNNA